MNNIQTNGLMSFFNAPIAPVKDERGHVTMRCTMRPYRSLTLQQVYRLLTADELLMRLTDEVRNAPDLNTAKRERLPYITPFGTFSYRTCSKLTAFSGLLPIDIDHLHNAQEAEEVQQALFNDPYLDTRLAFVSPSGTGVKALVPWPAASLTDDDDVVLSAARFARQAMEYVALMHDPHPDERQTGVDVSGKDVVRACFLCHDANTLLRR